jgi:poly-gamma-glutamate synthesis protein (capsule biosynthesis protein)
MTNTPENVGADIKDPYPWPPIDADVSLGIVGDINIQHRADPSSAFQHVKKSLAEFDLKYGNLEGCLYQPGDEDIPDKTGWQHSDEEMIAGIRTAGFDALGGANNVNYGQEAVMNTIQVLDDAGIEHCGIGTTINTAREPAIITVNDTTFGFMQWTARYYSRDAWATPNSPGVAAFDPSERRWIDPILADINELRDNVDVVVFSHHVRQTSTNDIEDYQRELAHNAIDAGADLVFGHGAHRNQEIELYNNTAIFHCIGQFPFDWTVNSHKRDGLLLRIHVTDGEIHRISFVPVFRDIYNNVYLAGPDVAEGDRQLDELTTISDNDPFSIEGPEAVLTGLN